LYLAGPLLLAFVAAALHRYPFMAHFGGSRLMLFSAPLLYLLVAMGGVAAVSLLWHSRLYWLAPLLIAGLLLSLQPVQMMQEILRPSLNRSQLKPLVARLERERQPGDAVYVYYYAIYPFKYYFRGNLAGIYWGKSCVERDLDLSGTAASRQTQKAGRPRQPRRLWLISGHYPSLEYMETFAAGLLGPGWRQTARYLEEGAVLYLFEPLGEPPANRRSGQPAPSVSGSPGPAPGKACK
ncbi:MAG: hypothetical protein JRI59_11105, partial [Deltaproteobacteria bacterium]|nr:hypothetical protein [Deltaproteobacteria bacterium]